MIRVNLNVRQRTDAENSNAPSAGPIEGIDGFVSVSDKEIKKQGATRLLIMLMFPLALYVWESQSVPKLKGELGTRTNLLNELTRKNESASTALAEFKKFQLEQSKIQSQITIIEDLKKGRMQEVKVLDSIQRMIPPKVWLEKVDLSGGKVLIQGFATTDAGMTSFMDALSRSVFLREVSLIKANQDEREMKGMILRRFEIACVLEKVQ